MRRRSGRVRPKQRWLYGFGIALWVALVWASMNALWSYKSTAGVAASGPETWPVTSSIPRAERGATLLMFAHPRCSCTRASLAELARVIAGQPTEVTSFVVLMRPEGVDDRWLESDIVEGAKRMSGVRLVIDQDGTETARFGSATSGQVLLYDDTGELAFRGGITGARGHEGDNRGRMRLSEALAGVADRRSGWVRPTANQNNSPVFGCDLFSLVHGTAQVGPSAEQLGSGK